MARQISSEQVTSSIRWREVNWKRWSVDRTSTAAAWVSPTEFMVTAGQKNALLVSERDGVILKGDTSFTSMPYQVKFAGMYEFTKASVSTLPSTIMSPVPTFRMILPQEGIIRAMKSLISDLREVLG